MQDQRGVILCEFALIIEASQNGLMHSRNNEGKYEMHDHIQTILPCENAHSVLVQIVKIISSWVSRRTLKTLAHHKGGAIHETLYDDMAFNLELAKLVLINW